MVLGRLLTHRGDYAEAEPLLTEGWMVCKATYAENHWRTAEARSILGECLVGLKRCEEAEPVLLQRYAAISEARSEKAKNAVEALERIVRFYDAWHEAEPNAGYDAKADEWRAKLERCRAATHPAATQPAASQPS